MKYLYMLNAWTIYLSILSIPASVSGALLWFETVPKENDPCTITRYSLEVRAYEDVHPDPKCTEGGLLWYATWGRIHLHFSLDNKTETNFRVCLTGGFANGIYIWYNYRDKFWEPLGFPNYMGIPPTNETCRDSHRGILDLFVESPWNKVNYGSFVTWEVTRHPDGWTDPDKEEDEAVITAFDKLERVTEKENLDDGIAELLEKVKDEEGIAELLEKMKGKE